jgi:uncharacterized lipoprotein YmbA
MNIRAWGPAALGAILLAGCLGGGGGKPTTYLQLKAVASGRKVEGNGGPPVAVAAIELPAALDRQDFIVAMSGTQMQINGSARWSGPLADMIRLALAQDLASRLLGTTVLMPGDPVPNGGARQVHASIQTFLPDANGSVDLQADWWVTAPDGHTVQRQGRFHFVVHGANNPPAEAEGMSGALGHLADTIAAAL